MRSLKAWARALKYKIYALHAASKDERISWVVKCLIVLLIAYALSPIDLIPDFIPILGYLDDLLLLPLGIALVIKMIPPDVWAECEDRARQDLEVSGAAGRFVAISIIAFWIILLSALLFLIVAKVLQT